MFPSRESLRESILSSAGIIIICVQSCLTLWDPVDYSLPGSFVRGIFPGKHIGVGCHFLVQGIFLSRGSNLRFVCLLHWQASSLPRVSPGVLPFLKIFFWSFLWHCSGKSFCYFDHSLFLTKNGFTRLTPSLPDSTLSGSSSVIKKQVYSQRINIPSPWYYFLSAIDFTKTSLKHEFPGHILSNNCIFVTLDQFAPKMTTQRCQCLQVGSKRDPSQINEKPQ